MEYIPLGNNSNTTAATIGRELLTLPEQLVHPLPPHLLPVLTCSLHGHRVAVNCVSPISLWSYIDTCI